MNFDIQAAMATVNYDIADPVDRIHAALDTLERTRPALVPLPPHEVRSERTQLLRTPVFGTGNGTVEEASAAGAALRRAGKRYADAMRSKVRPILTITSG